uniref:Uncharacterized protein n=2 Tax=Phaeomonas parva TaxID=124430 RepID=A0A7S1TRD7_9STRA|mmetsp:Transcript_14288/g.42839  ORF Transcript_14288/g.42839 Transcript_14288/m.42839 type:complete len:313 (+) Transcript_14288:296-1234(+)
MEQVFFGLHENCVRSITSALNPRQRVVGLVLLCLTSLSLVAALVLLHAVFASDHAHFECLPDSPVMSTAVLVDLAVAHGGECVGSAVLHGAAPGGGEGCFIDHVATFARDKGFLALPRRLLGQHRIEVATLVVRDDDACLGPPIAAALLRHVVGYDTFWLNWALRYFGGGGYFHSLNMETVQPLAKIEQVTATKAAWPSLFALKLGSLCAIAFLFYVVSTMVSFTLRQTQNKMLRFTYMLERSVRYGMPYRGLVMTHVVDSLVFVPMMVGMLFFLFQFYDDQVLALLVLSCVWLSEVYAIIACRTRGESLTP